MRNIKSKKGLSTIVTTLIIVALSLVAVGIIWVVVNNILQNRSTEVNYLDKCMGQKVEITKATCSKIPTSFDYTCTSISAMRTLGSETINGVRFVFTNSSGGKSIVDKPGNLVAISNYAITDNFLPGRPTKIEIIAYFNSSNGAAQPCPTGSEFSNIIIV